MVSLPIAEPIDCAAAMVASEHESCRTISSNFMIGTGLKKCIPMTLSGRSEACAISEIESEDVFVAKIQSSFVSMERTWNILAFISKISGTASITKSTSLTAFLMSENV